MSQCVPSWEVEDNPDHNPNPGGLKFALRAPSNSVSSTLDVPTLDYEVAELTWKNGQLAMNGLGPRRVVNKPQSTASVLTKYTWDKPRAGETLEAIVNQATLLPHRKTQIDLSGNELVPWLDHRSSAIAAGSVSASATMTMDALVPSSNNRGSTGAAVGCSTRVGSCSGGQAGFDDQRVAGGGGQAGSPAAGHECSSCRDQSVSGSATFGMESSRQLTTDTCERELGVKGFTSTSMGSPGNTSSGKRCTKSTSPDEHDSVCHSRPPTINLEEKKKARGKSSISTKRSRAAAIHNQSERKRRDKINERMKTLQKLVPNANKTDKASMLDEVIEYLKQLQAQVHMMNRMNMSPMMMPLAMQQQQQQLQMAMMNPMAMGMGMGMSGVLDFNAISGRHGMSPVFHPSTFMQPTMASWDINDRVSNPNDPLVAFLACQSQPMTVDAYSRMAALYQQMQSQHASGLKN